MYFLIGKKKLNQILQHIIYIEHLNQIHHEKENIYVTELGLENTK